MVITVHVLHTQYLRDCHKTLKRQPANVQPLTVNCLFGLLMNVLLLLLSITFVYMCGAIG